ncbi:MAG: UDP-N-acetylmuramoyl-tripeptide--D-alanyl-D-alanine ligase [Candidatus Krumholzibacteria bacterium]|nr:UDP-N-acetylmuramoyl-tripeptide--D-alanyl-D-alanine ligase [Candidatus Krumholzibacteria bacterium]
MTGNATPKPTGPDQGFALAEAIALLAEAGLLAAVLLPGDGGAISHEPAAAAELATGHFAGARLDSRLLQAGELFVALPGEFVHGRNFAANWLAEGGWVLTDVAPNEPLLEAPLAAGSGVLVSADAQQALATLATHWRQHLSARIVGVTGTNGKTTTKDFLAAALGGGGATHATAGNFNNHLGLPLTLLGLRAEHQYAVIEMGASAQGEIDYLAGLAQPEVGIITNASPAHLAEFGSLEGIIAGKGELLDHLPAAGKAILNTDSPGWPQWNQRAQCAVISCGSKSGDHRWSAASGEDGPTLLLDGVEWPVPLPGEHNAANLALAILAARAVGVSDEYIRAGLLAFHGSPPRGILLQIGGRTVLDDAYNANPGSMVAAGAALRGLAGEGGTARTFAVLGHMAELGPNAAEIHRNTGRQLAELGLDILVAVGSRAQALSEGFDAVAGGGHYCAAVDEAARWLATHTRHGDHILIKGSRSAAMEEILPLLAEACGDSASSSENQI